MHELSIAQRLVDRAIEAAADEGATRVEAVVIEVGQATHLVPDQLAVCIDAVAADTVVEEATITFEQTEARGRCSCGWTGALPTLDDAGPTVPSLRCPDCADALELTAGRECRLRRISVPDDSQQTI